MSPTNSDAYSLMFNRFLFYRYLFTTISITITFTCKTSWFFWLVTVFTCVSLLFLFKWCSSRDRSYLLAISPRAKRENIFAANGNWTYPRSCSFAHMEYHQEAHRSSRTDGLRDTWIVAKTLWCTWDIQCREELDAKHWRTQCISRQCAKRRRSLHARCIEEEAGTTCVTTSTKIAR